MTSINERFITQARDLAWIAPLAGTAMGVGGALYAKVQGLPIKKAAAAYAIWGLAAATFESLASVITDDPKKLLELRLGLITLVNGAAILLLRQKGLMNNLLTLVAVSYHCFSQFHEWKKQGVN